MVIPNHRMFTLLEAMVTIDPPSTYLQRAASALAELLEASGYRLCYNNNEFKKLVPLFGSTISIQLIADDKPIGTIDFFFHDNQVKEEKRQLANWGSRILARGITVSTLLNHTMANNTNSKMAKTSLTKRERQIVNLLVAGASTKSISSATGLTVSTVNTYLKRIFAKLGVHSRVELIALITGNIRENVAGYSIQKS